MTKMEKAIMATPGNKSPLARQIKLWKGYEANIIALIRKNTDMARVHAALAKANEKIDELRVQARLEKRGKDNYVFTLNYQNQQRDTVVIYGSERDDNPIILDCCSKYEQLKPYVTTAEFRSSSLRLNAEIEDLAYKVKEAKSLKWLGELYAQAQAIQGEALTLGLTIEGLSKVFTTLKRKITTAKKVELLRPYNFELERIMADESKIYDLYSSLNYSPNPDVEAIKMAIKACEDIIDRFRILTWGDIDLLEVKERLAYEAVKVYAKTLVAMVEIAKIKRDDSRHYYSDELREVAALMNSLYAKYEGRAKDIKSDLEERAGRNPSGNAALALQYYASFFVGEDNIKSDNIENNIEVIQFTFVNPVTGRKVNCRFFGDKKAPLPLYNDEKALLFENGQQVEVLAATRFTADKRPTRAERPNGHFILFGDKKYGKRDKPKEEVEEQPKVVSKLEKSLRAFL